MSSSPAPQLYAPRTPIFPKWVTGRFRRLKWALLTLTLAIYYITPWLRWDRGPGMPDQAVLVDLANRRFYVFWIEIWPHEFYFVAGLLIMAGFGLFLFTSAFGRVWCGYACPQTVWTDLFLLVERRIEGDRNAQTRLWNAPWSLHKLRLRVTKWSVWLVIAMATGGAWVFYFTDAPTLGRDLLAGTAHPITYTTIAILTATTFVFGGFMREQVCIYMCPWPRIQGTMMDDSSLTVAYRAWRGEPRGKHRKAATAEPLGDCIDCSACVNVCPMGIDIRDGQQMECITCALCIDACDDIMAKIGKPRGLIDYLALEDEAAERAGTPPRPLIRHILRPRTVIYTLLWGAIGVALLILLFVRSEIALTVAPVRNPTHVVLSDGGVRNAYVLRLRNQTGHAVTFDLSLAEPSADLTLSIEGNAAGDHQAHAAPDEMIQVRAYVVAAPGSAPATTATTPLRFWAALQDGSERAARDTTFHGRTTQ